MSGGEGYVAAAYLVFLALVLIYVAIMAVRLSRMQRDIAELNELADRRHTPPAPDDDRETVSTA
jgi:hypothetical protein